MDLTISKDGFLTAKGIAHIMGMDMDVYLEGSFSLDPYKKEITYYITKANVNGFMPVPKSILDKFSKKINPVFEWIYELNCSSNLLSKIGLFNIISS